MEIKISDDKIMILDIEEIQKEIENDNNFGVSFDLEDTQELSYGEQDE